MARTWIAAGKKLLMGRTRVAAASVAAMVATGLLGVLVGAAPASAATASDFQMTYNSLGDRAAHLAAASGVTRQTSWANVLGSGSIARPSLSTCNDGTAPSSSGFCFSPQDESNTGPINGWSFYPQGISTTADSQGTIGGNAFWGRLVVAEAWHEYTSNRALFITFTDWDGSQPDVYNRVLLVLPGASTGTPTISDERMKPNGLVWYGHLLYVTGTWDGTTAGSGVTLFDMNTLLDVGGNSALKSQAHGFRFILPAVGEFRSSGNAAVFGGAMSLDRSSNPRALVIAEYKSTGTSVLRFDMYDAESSDGPWPVRSSGVATASAYYTGINFPYVQGVLAHNDTYYFTRQNGTGNPGYIQAFNPLSGQLGALKTWAQGCEGLSYWAGLSGSDAVLGDTEYVHHRYAFSAPPSVLPPAP
jgi:hypothetical protein